MQTAMSTLARLTVIAALAGATLDALLPEPLERVRVREQRQRAKVRAALKWLR
jgi:hypothetical protein